MDYIYGKSSSTGAHAIKEIQYTKNDSSQNTNNV